jgi:hypothetical protein
VASRDRDAAASVARGWEAAHPCAAGTSRAASAIGFDLRPVAETVETDARGNPRDDLASVRDGVLMPEQAAGRLDGDHCLA